MARPLCVLHVPRLSSAAAHSPTPFQNPIYSSSPLICSFLVSTLNCCSHVIVTRIFTLSLTLLGLLSSPSPLFCLHSSLTCAFSILTVYALTIARPCPLSIRYYSGFLPPSKKCSSFQACSPPSLLNIYFVLLFIFFIFLSSLLICLPSSSSSSSSSC